MKHVLTTSEVLSYSIFTSTLDQISTTGKTLINTINQYSYVMAEKDKYFKDALMHSDILLPDGIGIVGASMLLSGKKIKKIAGIDLHDHLLKKLNKEGGSCFYLGSSDHTLNKIRDRLSFEFPEIKAGFYMPPFRSQFSSKENEEMINAVNTFAPDVLFIGLAAPKQEKWAYENKELLNAKIIAPIGAAFDFYAGTINRPTKIWIDLGLEWLGRLLKEPKRLWKRYLYYGFVFVYMLLKEKAKQVLQMSYNKLTYLPSTINDPIHKDSL